MRDRLRSCRRYWSQGRRWLSDGFQASVAHDHRGKGCVGDKRSFDPGLAAELPHAAPVADARDVNFQGVARHHRLAETRLVDRHEVYDLAVRFIPEGVHHQGGGGLRHRSEEHTSELQSLMRISYDVFCLKKKSTTTRTQNP